jgi:chemotaxis response regulator CheB
VERDEQPAVIVPTPVEDGLVPVDRLLITAASAFKQRLTVVLLSGANTGEQAGVRAIRENGGRIILRKRASGMVTEPLDRVADADLADAEVNPAKLVETVIDGFEL